MKSSIIDGIFFILLTILSLVVPGIYFGITALTGEYPEMIVPGFMMSFAGIGLLWILVPELISDIKYHKHKRCENQETPQIFIEFRGNKNEDRFNIIGKRESK